MVLELNLDPIQCGVLKSVGIAVPKVKNMKQYWSFFDAVCEEAKKNKGTLIGMQLEGIVEVLL